MSTAKAHVQLLRQLINPGRGPGVRLPVPGIPALTSTLCLAKPIDLATLSNKTSTRAMLTDNPVLPFWCETQEEWYAAYDFGMVATRPPDPNTEQELTYGSILPSYLPTSVNGMSINAQQPVNPYPVSFLGRHSGLDYVYVPAGCQATFVLIPGSSTMLAAGYARFSVMTRGVVSSQLLTLEAHNFVASVTFVAATSCWLRPTNLVLGSIVTADSLALFAVVSNDSFSISYPTVKVSQPPPIVTGKQQRTEQGSQQ